MSGSSELTYRVRGTGSVLYDASYAVVDDKVTRYHLVNNLNHYSDIHGQVRAHWSSRVGGPAKTPYIATSFTTWRNVMTTPPFPIAMRADGTPYRLRIRVGGSISNVAGGPGRIAVIVSRVHGRSPPETVIAGAYAGTQPSDSVWVSDAMNSTTPAFLTGTSKGTSAWSNMIGLTASESADFLTSTDTPIDIGGAAAGVPQCMVSVMAFAFISNASYETRLYYLEATEWYG